MSRPQRAAFAKSIFVTVTPDPHVPPILQSVAFNPSTVVRGTERAPACRSRAKFMTLYEWRSEQWLPVARD